MLKTKSIYTILKKGDSSARLNLFDQLPDNTMKESARVLIASNTTMTTLLGFGSLLPVYCHGANCVAGASLGLAVYQFGKESFQSNEHPDLFLMTIVDFAHSYLTACVYLGKFEDANEFLSGELPFWELYRLHPERLNANEWEQYINSLKSVMVIRINVLMHLNRIDEAWDIAFNEPWIEGNWASDIELQRLRANLKGIKAEVGRMDTDANHRRKEADKQQQSSANVMLDALKQMMGQQGMDEELIDKLRQSIHLDPYTREGFEQLDKNLTQGESFLQKYSGELNEISVRQKIRRASGIFVNNQPSRDQIMDSLEVIEKSLLQAIKLKNNILINDAYYGLYLCYSRLGQTSEAADQLTSLRKNLESVREGIKNPLERSGVFQSYPYLFSSLSEHLFKSKRYNEMLDAIEGSKGRTITDVLEKESVIDAQKFDLYNIKDRLHPYLSKENAHYITFHVDDDWSYALLVTKEGNVYADEIQIGKQHLEKWFNANINNPQSWQNQFVKIDIIQELQPFASMLGNLYHEGKIQENDHICYSADHLLYLFPIHFLKINGKSLIELFTFSRIHNAGHLIQLLSKPVRKPDTCLTVDVPSNDDVKNPKVLEYFKKSSGLLNGIYAKRHINLHHEKASQNQVFDSCTHNQLIHFAAHGYFPLIGNPFNNSGLLVADQNKLPNLYIHDPDYSYKDEGLHLLSPERLLAGIKNGQLNNSHVSLQACVAGYAREGIGGDALGIEWALFQKGVSSLISTFWNIDIQNANEFYAFFYDEWLNRNTTKAQAHQKAVLKLKMQQRSNNLPDEYFWAGYGLIGDWR